MSSSETSSPTPADSSSPGIYTREYARDYARLRPVDDAWWRVLEAIVAAGDLPGRRVLDVACGTGSVAAALAERGCDVWGVDASPEMLSETWSRGLPRDRFVLGHAESLPFGDGSFERTLMRLAVHQVDRARALPELHRVLVPRGRALVATFDPGGFDDFWVTQLFPEVHALDSERFPTADGLAAELDAAGFARVDVRTHRERASLPREEALERLRGRFISTLHLLDDDAFARGVARAEAELPPVVEFERPWFLVGAERA